MLVAAVGRIWRRRLVSLRRHCWVVGVMLLLLLLSLLLLLLPKLHPRVGAWCQRWEGGGPWTNHGARLEGLQVAGEEGRLEASARTALDDTAVGRQLVVVA